MGLVGKAGFWVGLTIRPGTVVLPRGIRTMVPGGSF